MTGLTRITLGVRPGEWDLGGHNVETQRALLVSVSDYQTVPENEGQFPGGGLDSW